MGKSLDRLAELEKINAKNDSWKAGKAAGWYDIAKGFARDADEWRNRTGEVACALERLAKECKCPMFFGYSGECEHMAPGEFACRDCPVYAAYSALEAWKKAEKDS